LFGLSLLPFVLHGRVNLYLGFLYLFTYTGVQTNFQMMFVSVNSNRKGAIIGKRTAYPSGSHEFESYFNGVLVTQSYFTVYGSVLWTIACLLVFCFLLYCPFLADSI
jgi:hypothetical protein